MKGSLIIITSPSGGGKGTLIREVLATMPEMTYSVSYTTRPTRAGEKDGREYFFISREEFEERRDKGEFLEYAMVHGNLYGTSRSQIEKITNDGKDVILEIDVQGANIILEKEPDTISVFILPPSFATLSERLKKRATESPKEIELRLRNAFSEVQQFKNFRYLVVNEVLKDAADDIRAIIRAERLKTVRRKDDIRGILGGFDVSKTTLLGE